MILFDIETKPRPDLVTRFIKPFEKFDPSAVKYRNTKDPALREAKLAEEQNKHTAAEAAYWQNAMDRAALNPQTGEIVAIGLRGAGNVEILGEDDCGEKIILDHFWNAFANPHHSGEAFVFWSGNGSPTENFDPDYIIRRSWILGVKVPPLAFGDGGYLGRRFVDAARRYLLGKRDAYCGLSRCADELGLYTKDGPITPKLETDPVQGANFWQWWEGTAPKVLHPSGNVEAKLQRELAKKYLVNDLLTLDAITARIR